METEFHVSTSTDNDCNVSSFVVSFPLLSRFLYDNNGSIIFIITIFIFIFIFISARLKDSSLTTLLNYSLEFPLSFKVLFKAYYRRLNVLTY